MNEKPSNWLSGFFFPWAKSARAKGGIDIPSWASFSVGGVPLGTWIDWTPGAMTGFSSEPAGGVYRYLRLGKTCWFTIRQPAVGTSDAVTLIIPLPFTAATITNQLWMFPASVIDAGASAVWGRGAISSAGTTISFGLSVAADAGFTPTGNKRVAVCDGWYEVA